LRIVAFLTPFWPGTAGGDVSLSDREASHGRKPSVPVWLEWTATVAVFAVYFSYILAIAFSPAALGQRVAADMPLTWGMLAGVGVIAFSIAIAGWYTARANRN